MVLEEGLGAAAAGGLVWVSRHRPAPGTSGLAANPDSERPKSQTSLRTVSDSQTGREKDKKGTRPLSGQRPRYEHIAANQTLINLASTSQDIFGCMLEDRSELSVPLSMCELGEGAK